MSLSLKSQKGKAVFAWSDGPMSATWTISDSMTEAEIMEALLAMVKFVRVQPGDADVIPLHPVPTTVSIHEPVKRGGWSNPEPAMGWTPAPVITPPPLGALMSKAGANGFELYDPDDDAG